MQHGRETSKLPRASGQVRVTHQIPVALARGATTLIDRPDDEALSTAAVAGGEDAFDARRVLFRDPSKSPLHTHWHLANERILR